MMGGTASWAVMAVVIRHLSADIHAFEVVFFRSLFGAGFLLPWLFRTGLRGLYTQRLGMHLARGLLGLAAAYLVFAAIGMAPLGEVAAIMSTRPIFASVAAVLVLREAMRGRRWAATFIGFAGTLLILRPGFAEISTGALLMVAAVFVMVSVSIVIKSLARTESPDCIAMWQMVIFTPMTVVPALLVWPTPSLLELALLVAVGLTGTLNQRALTRAYAAADATVVLPFEFSRLVFSALLGFLVFGEFPMLWTWLGGAMILLGTMTMAHLEGRETRAASRLPAEDMGRTTTARKGDEI
jgi:drug/metabolite transporter (DMT)-like permease